jgi:hypothetical protein
MEILAFFVAAGSFNLVRYIYYKRRLIHLVGELRPEIHETVERSKFRAFIRVPKEVGNDIVDLIWFKAHLAAGYTISFFLFAAAFLAVLILFALLY